MTKQIFISYSRKDADDFVKGLVADLEARGVYAWLDQRDIQAGQRWDRAVQRALRDCEYFLVVLSPQAVESDNVLDEIAYALDKSKRVFPVLYKDCETPFRLRRIQYIDFQSGYKRGLERLIGQLELAGVSMTAATAIAPREFSPPDMLELTTPVAMQLMRVPAGEFLMGSDNASDQDAYNDEFPQHRVYLQEFYISKYPVTNAQYEAFVKASNYKAAGDWQKYAASGKENHPVVNISWHDAQAFCEWLSKESRQTFCLPTEAEWEKAARGGLISSVARRVLGDVDARIFPWGDAFDEEKCNSRESGIGTTAPVGKYSPGGDSIYGAADMSGNVWEWCSSLYEAYPYAPEDGREDLLPTSTSRRVVRGGAWLTVRRFVRCAARNRFFPTDVLESVGFRLISSG